jgi:hypothetical protein
MNLKMKEKKGMKKIKSFIYLDNYKMYSISSQLFEGLTEYIVTSDRKGSSEHTEQKGKLGTGKIMADIIQTESEHTEKRFLHHSSYNLFEEELIKENRVLMINSEDIDSSIQQLSDYSFVKVTNKVGFNDTKYVREVFSRFNEIGESLAFISHHEEIQSFEQNVENIIKSTKDRNDKAKIQALAKNKSQLTELAKAAGLHLDPQLLKSFATVIDYGYNDSFEVQMPFATDDSYHLFSCLLNRELLSEQELNIIKKYSRETEKQFTIFGIPTQVKTLEEKSSIYQNAVSKIQAGSGAGMKEAIMNIIASLTSLENTFVGKLDYEYIIDPIAIYREL